MMSKYQLVFARIEKSTQKILTSNRNRELSFKQKAFTKMLAHAVALRQKMQYRGVLVSLIVGKRLKKFVTALSKQHGHCLAKVLNRWRSQAMKLSQIAKWGAT